MPQVIFSDRWLQSLKADVAAEYSDSVRPNLRLRIGRRLKTFSVMIGPAGARRRVTLGRYPGLTLAEARRKAAATSDDPMSIPIARKESRYGTVKELFDYVLEAMKAEGKGCEPNRLYLRDGPLAAMNHLGSATLARNVRRKRGLDELKIFWREFPKHTQAQTASAARMIIAMGGVRVLEILGSRKSWWTDGANPQLALPKTKNATAHVLPLMQAAQSELKVAFESADPESEFLYQNFARPTEPMPANALAQAVRCYCEATKTEPFQPRDLRRTMKSHLLDSDADLREEWVDIWHNHGRHADVARMHYDRAEYTRAKQKVADAVDWIVDCVKG